MNPDLVNIIIAIGCLIIPSWQLIHNKDKRGIKRITWVGWVLLLLSLIMLANYFWSKNQQYNEHISSIRITDSTIRANDSLNKLDRKNDRDSTILGFQNALKEYGQQYNPVTGKIVSIKPIITSPALNSPNPIVTKKSEDVALFTITIVNRTEAAAKNIKTFFYTITPIGDSFYLMAAKNNLSNELIILDNKNLYSIEKPIYPGKSFEKAYLYIKLLFTDEKNSPQPPFREVFIFNKDDFNKNLTLPTEKELSGIKKFLIGKGEW